MLHHVEEHEKEYDAIFWIDARSEETARSSYVRCYRALGLPSCDSGVSPGRLQDEATAQSELAWLRSQEAERRWLLVVNNVDDLSWDVAGIVPVGKAGSVIVTSQDRQAPRLLGGKSESVAVDVMEAEEAESLLLTEVSGGVNGNSDEFLL